MQNVILSIILLYSLTACGNNEEQSIRNAKIEQEAKAQKDALLAELQAKDEALKKAKLEVKAAQAKLRAQEQAQKIDEKKETKHNEKLEKAGIYIEENVITIDTNKTKDFFKNISKKLEDKLKKITKEIEKGMLDEKDAGVQIDKSHINIDLDKTKDFLETWGQKMQGFVKEFDNMAKELDINKTIQ